MTQILVENLKGINKFVKFATKVVDAFLCPQLANPIFLHNVSDSL